jgi:hypothetical protein
VLSSGHFDEIAFFLRLDTNKKIDAESCKKTKAGALTILCQYRSFAIPTYLHLARHCHGRIEGM